MKKQIFYKPAVQVENIGDLLINLVELDLLRPYGQVIIDDSATPAWFVDEISTDKNDKLLSQISDKPLLDALIDILYKQRFSKGEKIEYYLVIQPGHTSRKGLKRAVKHVQLNLKYHLLNMLGCKIVRIGFSIGPFDIFNGLSEAFASYSYSYYAVRDKESLKIAQKYKFRKPHYFPDLAWAYAPEKNNNGIEKEYIVISMRSNAFGVNHDSAYLMPLIKRIKDIMENSGQPPVKIVVAYQVKYDREPSIEIYESLKNDYDVELIDHKLTLKEAISLYGGANYIISNRLHVLLLALKCGSLSFPLVDKQDNKKITSIFSDNALNNLILDIKESGEENIKKLNAVLADEENSMKGFKKAQESNHTTIRQKLSELFTA